MKRLVFLIMSVLLVVSLTVAAYANDLSDVREGEPSIEIDPPEIEGPSMSSKEELDRELESITDEIPKVSVNALSDYLTNKGNDIISVIQTVGRYVCIAAFAICCLLTIIGLIGNKRMLVGALIGLVISGVAYAGVICAPEIVHWIASWAATV